MPDYILNIKGTGEEDLLAKLKAMTKEMGEQNKTANKERSHAEAINRLRKQQHDLARQERKEAFERLGVEEKLLRLQQQRERIQERLTKAQGNEYRTAALQAKLAETNAAIRGLGRHGEGGEGGLGRFGEVGALLTGFLPALAGLAGIAGIIEKFKGTLEHSKQLEDIALQLNLGIGDMAQIRVGGHRIGLGERPQMQGLMALAASRSEAINGNAKTAAYFAQYGISPEMLNGPMSVLDIGRRITGSLGADGVQQGDVTGLRQLFGPGATRMIALFKELGHVDEERTAHAEHEIRNLSEVNRKLEEFNAQLESLWRRGLVNVIDWFKNLQSHNDEIQRATTGMAQAFHGKNPVLASGTSTPLVGGPMEAALGIGIGAATLALDAQLNKRTALLSPPSNKDSVVTNDDNPSFPSTANALARVGLFVGGRQNSTGEQLLALQRQHLDVLGRINAGVQHMAHSDDE